METYIRPSKFDRVFEQIDELKERVTRVEVFEEHEREVLKDIVDRLDDLSTTLNQIVGKNSIMSSIFGVIGGIITGVVIWLITLLKGN